MLATCITAIQTGARWGCHDRADLGASLNISPIQQWE